LRNTYILGVFRIIFLAKLLISFILSGLSVLSVWGQYDYFSIIEGSYGDTVLESTASVEVVPDGYVSLGLYSTIGYNHIYLYKYDFQGNRIDSNAVAHPNEFVYIGRNNNFRYSSQEDQFAFCCGIQQEDASIAGYYLRLDSALDTIFSKRYEAFERTYIRGISNVQGGSLLLGVHGNIEGTTYDGSFIAKVDMNGEYEWIEVLHTPTSGMSYGNRYAEETANGFIIAGYKSVGDLFGVLTLMNPEGEVNVEIEYQDTDYDQWSMLGLAKLESEEFMIVQSLGYEEFPNDFNLDYYWKNIRLAKIDPVTGEETWSQIYHEDYTLANGDWLDIEPTPDGGVIVLGWAYEPDYLYYNWMMKVDANGNEEWFKTYTAEECTGCLNFLQDIEVAPDGGYIGAGSFEYWEVDDLRNSWLLKVDACGDVEWQGCEPLGVSAIDPTELALFPNPAADQINLSTDLPLESYQIFDSFGRLVGQGVFNQTTQININSLTDGVYFLQTQTDRGVVKKKFVVSR